MQMDDLRPQWIVRHSLPSASTLSHPIVLLLGVLHRMMIFFQAREASNPFYNNVPDVVQHYMDEIAITGRQYHLFDYYGADDAEHGLSLWGQCDSMARDVIDLLRQQGKKVVCSSCIHIAHSLSSTSLRYFPRA